MENTYTETTQAPKRDSNKIYFLILVIVALLGTNVYLFFKDKKSNTRIVTLTDEKSRMETEIDKIEAELDKANNSNVKLSKQMQESQELARQKISELRTQLNRGKLTQGELAKAQKEIKELRFFVTKYTSDIEDLKKKNTALTVERDSLKSTVASVSERASNLEQQNTELNDKVKIASALKTGSINIIPLKIRRNGKETDVTKASAAKKFRVSFTVAENAIAPKGMHDIFVRIIDPNGNLIISDNGSLFTSEGDDLQYTYKSAIEFDNAAGKVFNVDWANPHPFQKGTYTVVLYADGYTMGKSSITLK